MFCLILLLQISLLDTAVNHLKANLKSAADLISLPTTVEELQKVKAKKNGIWNILWLYIFYSRIYSYSNFLYYYENWLCSVFFQSVATIGSTLTSVQHDVKTMQAVLENQKKDDDLKKTMVNLSQWYVFIVYYLDSLFVNRMVIGHQPLQT